MNITPKEEGSKEFLTPSKGEDMLYMQTVNAQDQELGNQALGTV